MNLSPEEKQLLDDILAEGGEFREALLNHTLDAVRTRRRIRRVSKSLCILVTALALVIFWLPTRNQESNEPVVLSQVVRPFLLVRSHALPSNAVVRTIPGQTTIIESSSAHVQIVENSSESNALRQLDERELLKFFAGRSAGIVQISQTEQMLLLTREDAKGFPLE